MFTTLAQAQDWLLHTIPGIVFLGMLGSLIALPTASLLRWLGRAVLLRIAANLTKGVTGLAKGSKRLSQALAGDAERDALFYAVWQGAAVVLSAQLFLSCLLGLATWVMIRGWSASVGQLTLGFFVLVLFYLWLSDFASFMAFTPWSETRSPLSRVVYGELPQSSPTEHGRARSDDQG